MRKLLFWLTSHLPCRIIAEEGSVYLERYYLFTLLGWRFYLHRFVGSDPDRGLHDHPWSRAFSIILAGWYWEQTRSGTRKDGTDFTVVTPQRRFLGVGPDLEAKIDRAC